MANKAALGTFSLGGSAVGDLRSWDLTNEASEIDTTIMGTTSARFQPGSVRQQLEVSVFYADPDDAGQAVARGNVGSETVQAIVLNPFGTTTGQEQLTGDAYIMSANFTGEADGAVEMTMNLSADEDGFTWGTVP